MSAPTRDSNVATARSPFAGCTIMIAALLVMVFLIGFSIWSVFRLDEEIGKFTETEPKPVPVASLENREAQMNDLKTRIEAFHHQLTLEKPEDAMLSLTPEELNLAIAMFEPLKDLRGTFHVEDIEDDLLHIAISFQLHANPLKNTFRYLNGTLLARPELMDGEIVLRVESVETPGDQPVAEEFIAHLSPYRLTQRYKEDPVLGPAMARLTGVELRDGRLHLRQLANENPPVPVTAAEAEHGKQRFVKLFGFAALLFLIFVAAVLIVGLRKRKKSDFANE